MKARGALELLGSIKQNKKKMEGKCEVYISELLNKIELVRKSIDHREEKERKKPQSRSWRKLGSVCEKFTLFDAYMCVWTPFWVLC